MPKLDVVLPVVDQYDYTHEILGHFVNQTRVPDKIIIIDNSSEEYTSEQIKKHWMDKLPISLQRQTHNIGYNASIQLGILVSDADIVSILNNDLTIPPWFFEFVLQAFENPNVGYVVPFTHPDRNLVISQKRPTNNRLAHQPNREGWAFSMRRMIALAAGQIPQGCFTFYGDDFLCEKTQAQGYACMKCRDLVIFHWGSRSLYSSGGAEYLGSDMKAYQEYIKQEIAARRRKS